MGKVTDYKAWLSDVDLGSHENVYNLYNSVNNFESSGIFHTSKEVTNTGYEYLVKADGNADSLFLGSDEQKFLFLDYLGKNYTDSEDADIEKWYKLKAELGRID